MRKELADINGVRKRFIATFVRYGSKGGYQGRRIKTLLFESVRERDGKVYCDHIWFTTNQTFDKLNLSEGDHICFDARVKPYIKGYRGNREDVYDAPISKDYKLSHPNNIVKSEIGSPQQLF